MDIVSPYIELVKNNYVIFSWVWIRSQPTYEKGSDKGEEVLYYDM